MVLGELVAGCTVGVRVVGVSVVGASVVRARVGAGVGVSVLREVVVGRSIGGAEGSEDDGSRVVGLPVGGAVEGWVLGSGNGTVWQTRSRSYSSKASRLNVPPALAALEFLRLQLVLVEPVLNSNATHSGCARQSTAQSVAEIPACDEIECASELTSRFAARGSAKLWIAVPGHVGASCA